MLFHTTERLEDLIVRHLSARKSATAAWLQQRISKEVRPYTLQAIYKELTNLQNGGVVVKSGNEYCIKLSWAIELVNLSQIVESNHLSSPTVESLLPAAGESRRWVFHDWIKMGNFWQHIDVCLFEASKSKVMFKWTYHPWFYLWERQVSFDRALRKTGSKFYRIVGGQTYLDRSCAKYWTPPLYQFSFASGPFEGEITRYIDVIDDYVLTNKLNARAVTMLDEFYNSIHSKADVDVRKTVNLLTEKVTISMHLEHNPKKAQKLRKKFCDFFGLTPQNISR